MAPPSDAPSVDQPKEAPKKETFVQQLTYLWARWYEAKKKSTSVVITKSDAFVGGVLSGLDLAAAHAIKRGDEELANEILHLPDVK